MTDSTPIIGRFAPSPSGDLHFGSLMAALGSYLDARSQHGLWRVRIEDIDPPREIAGASHRILQQLERYGLEWDGQVVWQSQHHSRYREVLEWLITHRRSYYCTCTRKSIQQSGGYYLGTCRNAHRSAEGAALRLYQQSPVTHFNDLLRGTVNCHPPLAQEDFIIHRRDGLFAYNLAVTVDDHDQGVTQVVRGADLIEPTVRQIALYQQLGWTAPDYLHLPLALNQEGSKLSKQNHAPPLPSEEPQRMLILALAALGQNVNDEWRDLSVEQLIHQAIKQWQRVKIPINSTFITTDVLSTF
ncbi:tRNA glutamyl-Q(34) synthetase GluQRS [Rosenbergiella sp. S61]|uniref:Glutamyl-Q tRNA(Asp) synthetase n=1 Tax=Rosenbergiella gaditana TaxID=2726987 RepID=A0ABS5SW34_9GAMM|nr:tRNA glutamyl-Q(34) synthetase GluQRS [Rosenbergiella gaditana]MBT0724325.1 tRNA glutamyl-Q(34) synthetase GluQRS [Rosenbergiella gaditana]